MFGPVEYVVVRTLCGIEGSTSGDDVVLHLDAKAVSTILMAGSGTGEVGETGRWADKAVEEVSLFVDGEDPWWTACCQVAEATVSLDRVAEAALSGPVRFRLA